jgi:integrase
VTDRTYSATSVRQLAAVVDEVAPRDPARWPGRVPAPAVAGTRAQVSRSRADQLWMVVGMYDRAVGREEMPAVAARSVARLFTRPTLQAFWELAVAGELRARAEDVGRPLPLATQRIVRDVLGVLAALVVPGKAVLLPVVDAPELKPTVPERDLAALYRGLADLAAEGPLVRGSVKMHVAQRARLLAMVGIVLDTGARSGELAALRMDDLAPELEAVGVRRRQQRAPADRAEEIAGLAEVHPAAVRSVLSGHTYQHSEAVRQRILAAVAALPPLPEVEWYALRPRTRAAVRRWLEVREAVLAGERVVGFRDPEVEGVVLEGGRSALWVTLQTSKAGPPGVTLGPRGLRLAYTKGVTALNVLMAGRYGWSPLPLRMEQLRRAVTTEPLAQEAADR